jgi:hypothetical protein
MRKQERDFMQTSGRTSIVSTSLKLTLVPLGKMALRALQGVAVPGPDPMGLPGERGRTPKISKVDHTKCSSGTGPVLPAMYIHGGPGCGGNPHSSRILTNRTRAAVIMSYKVRRCCGPNDPASTPDQPPAGIP